MKTSSVLLFILAAPMILVAQITKPGYKAPVKKAAPVYNGPKKFTGKSKIIVEIDADGTLSVDYEKIWDFKKGDVWKSDIPPGEHRIQLKNGEETWKTTVETKSGQQLIVETELIMQKIRLEEAKRLVSRAAIAREQEQKREEETKRKAEQKRSDEVREEARLWAGTATLTDNRDGKTYAIVKFGDQVWMAANLNYNTTDSWCYDNSSGNCDEYGRVYKWSVANRACPAGWHLPSDEEWSQLTNYIGRNAGNKMKISTDWKSIPVMNLSNGGTNNSKFAALAAGARSSNGGFDGQGEYAYFWSSTAEGSSHAWIRSLYYSDPNVSRKKYFTENAYSCRCIRD